VRSSSRQKSVVQSAASWSETIGAVASCLPPSTQQGTLSSDQRTCTYASGTTVAFGAPLNVGQNEMLSSFTMTTAGKQCLAVNQGSTGIWVTTSAGTVSVTLDKTSTTLTVTCPDGEAYSGPYTILNSCPDSVPGSSEATVTSFNPDGGPTEGTFSLSLGDIGDGGTGSLSVFACATP
jgi:hypothetical protein